MIDPGHFLVHIIRPTLKRLAGSMNRDGIVGLPAQALMLGTAWHESELTWLQQRGGGPAVGFYQIEPLTHTDVWRWLRIHSHTAAAVYNFVYNTDSASQPTLNQLRANLPYSTAIARMIYWRRPEPLPELEAEGLARYHEQHYNTHLGAIGRTPDVLEAVDTFEKAIDVVKRNPGG